jgi:hypothetical protein
VGEISLAATDLRDGPLRVGRVEPIDDVTAVDDDPFPRFRGRPVKGEK